MDIVFAHRPDKDCPIEETCRAFDSVIRAGLSFYWGTSEWSAAEIVEAILTCEKLGLHKPVAEQPQYNMLARQRFESEYGIIFDKYKIGTTNLITHLRRNFDWKIQDGETLLDRNAP